MDFRDALKQLRKELGLTQMELANALHINFSTVGRWENGRNLPNRSLTAALVALARSRGVSSACLANLQGSVDQIAKDKLRAANGSLFTVEHASLGQLIDEASFPLYVCDMETDDLLYLNAKAEEMVGCRLEEMPSRKCYECLMHRDAPCEFCHKNELEEDRFFCYEARRAYDGAVFQVQGKRIKWNGRNAHVRYITHMDTIDSLGGMMNAMPGGIAVIEVDPSDIAGTLHTLSYNDGFFSYTGYTREEYDALLRQRETYFVFDEDIPMLLEATKKMCATGDEADITIRCHTKDGGYRWLLLTGKLVHRRDNICMINIVLVDVTKRKEAEDRQRISEEMLRIAAETDKRSLITYDVKADTCHVESQHLFSAKSGTTFVNVPDSVIDSGIVAPESTEEMRGLFNRIRKGERRVSASMQLRVGENAFNWFECNATTVLDQDGKPDHAVLVFHNITEQRLKEAVFKKWQQSIASRPAESYTLFRCNLSKNTGLDDHEGKLLKIQFSPETTTFNARTQAYLDQYVFPEDREAYGALLNSDTLLAMFYRGEHTATQEYREVSADGEPVWRLLTVEMVQYLNSTDVQVFLMYEDIDEKKKAELQEIERAQTDPLTGVLNRAAFAQKVDAVISQETGMQHALLMMDMDGFKSLNDTFGHAAGDQALLDAAAVMRSLTRSGDMVCRLGGDEFLIWLRGVPYDALIDKIARKICEQVLKAFSQDVQIGASIGIAVYPRDGHDFDELYHNADKALYRVKQGGKNNYMFFSAGEAAQPTGEQEWTVERTAIIKSNVKAKRRILIVTGDSEERAELSGIFKTNI